MMTGQYCTRLSLSSRQRKRKLSNKETAGIVRRCVEYQTLNTWLVYLSHKEMSSHILVFKAIFNILTFDLDFLVCLICGANFFCYQCEARGDF